MSKNGSNIYGLSYTFQEALVLGVAIVCLLWPWHSLLRSSTINSMQTRKLTSVSGATKEVLAIPSIDARVFSATVCPFELSAPLCAQDSIFR